MRIRVVAICIGVVAAGLTACGDDREEKATAPGEPPFKARVNITKDGYEPARVRILVGGQVKFVNVDKDDVHTAETVDMREGPSDNNEFDTHTLTWEEPYTITFHKPGTVEYFSSFDDEMKGVVEVVHRRIPGRDF